MGEEGGRIPKAGRLDTHFWEGVFFKGVLPASKGFGSVNQLANEKKIVMAPTPTITKKLPRST